MQLRDLQLPFKSLPYRNGQIFRRRYLCRELWDFLIQHAVVHHVEDFAMHDGLEVLQVDHKSRLRVRLALHRDLERVVVSVSIQVGALAENALVLFRRPLRIVVIMRGRELRFACQIDHGSSSYDNTAVEKHQVFKIRLYNRKPCLFLRRWTSARTLSDSRLRGSRAAACGLSLKTAR